MGLEFSGGFPAPTAEECAASALCRATLDAVGEPSLEYVAATDAVTADGTLSAALAPFLRGIGLTVDGSNALRPRLRPRLCAEQDFFTGGSAVSGSIGKLGWNLLGTGTPAASRQNPVGFASAQKLEPATSASVNDRTCLLLGDSETRGVSEAASVKLLQCVWRLDNVLTSKRLFFGLMDDFGVEPAANANCLGIYYDSAVSPNWQLIARAASAGSPVVSSAVVPANTAELVSLYQPVAGTWQFYLGNTLLGSISSGIPTPTMGIGFRLETLAVASKTFQVAYYGHEIAAAGAFDDDAFLET